MSLRLEGNFPSSSPRIWSRRAWPITCARAFSFVAAARVSPHFARLAEQVLQNARVPRPDPVHQRPKIRANDQPEFVTAIGLAKFGSFKNRKRESKSLFRGMFSRLLQK